LSLRDRHSGRLPAVGEVVVTLVVVSLFFERVDFVLYIERGFPIPNLSFVLAGLLVLAYAAALAYRRRLDLRAPSWAELTVVALIIVLGLTAVAASLAGGALSKPDAPRASAAIIPAVLPGAAPTTAAIMPAVREHPYDLTVRNGRVLQLPGVGLDAYFLHFTPAIRKLAMLGFRLGKSSIDRSRSYAYSVRLKSTSSPVRLSVVLRQWSPGSKATPFDTSTTLEADSAGWALGSVRVEPAPGERVLEPLILLPPRLRKTTLLVASAQLVSSERVPLAIPAQRGGKYRLESRGVEVRQHASGLTGRWTITAKSEPGKKGILRFLPDVHTRPVSDKHEYVFTALVHSARRPTTVTVGLRRTPSAGTKASETTQRATVESGASWTRVRVAMEAEPGAGLQPFVVFPSAGRSRRFVIWGARLARQPTTPQPVLVSHFGQSVKTLVHFAYFALIVLVLGRIFTPRSMRRAFSTFFVLAVAASILAVLQAIDQNALHTGASGALHLLSRSRSPSGSSGFLSPCSIFSEPAFLGYFALLGLLIGLRMYGSWHTRWVLVGIGFCLTAILLAAAAGPIVALAAVALYLAWRANHLWRRFWRELTALVVVGIAVLAFLPAGNALTTRASSIISGSDTSAKFRYAVDSASIRMWEISPLTGVGLGNARYYLPSLVDLSFDPNLSPQDAQFQSVSSYLSTLGESGVFGLLMLATMLITLVWPFGKRRSDDAWLSEAAILLFIVASFFITVFAAPVFWFFVAVRLADLRMPQLEAEAASATVPKSGLQPTLSG
jgi:O-antigen ligase